MDNIEVRNLEIIYSSIKEISGQLDFLKFIVEEMFERRNLRIKLMVKEDMKKLKEDITRVGPIIDLKNLS